MNPIKILLTMGTITAKNDGSLRFSANTPELTFEQKVKFMELQNQVLDTIFAPTGANGDLIEITTEASPKTQSQMLRAAIYVLWQKQNTEESWDSFYVRIMEKLRDTIKEKINETI